MVNAGRILIVPKGVWSSLTSYEMLDLVTQDGVAYIAKQANVGVQPKTDSQYTYWQPFGNAAEPDNETIVYNANNRYTVNLDDKTLVYDGDEGCITVAIDGTTIKFDEDEGYLYADVKSNLADLLDVVLTTPANGQVLTYNAVTGKWVNANPTGGMQAHLVIMSEAGSVVTVTTPSGSIITATQVSGSTTQWECDTQEYGVHTIDAVLAGDDAQITQMVDTCKIYNIDDSHIHASITVTFPRGFTARCQGQGENYYSNSNPYTFSVHHLGEYTITATDGANTTYTETVTISASAQSVSMFCPSAENAPTDDIQLWLMEGSILDKSYTTLSEVLSDSTTLATLIADNNAVDYMVRSKSWCGVGLVPKMTSATTPSGEVVCKSVDSTYPAYLAFDGDVNTAGRSHNTGVTSSAYIGYIFTEPTVVKSIYYKSATSASNTVSVQGYDGNNWTDIKTNVTIASSAKGYITFDNSTAYQGYRLYQTNASTANAFNFYVLQFYATKIDANITEDSTAMSYIGLNNYASNTLLADSDWLNAICNSAYFESVLNVKVPTMTDNTHPSGVVSQSSYQTGYLGYKAFDGVIGDENAWIASTSANERLTYQFPTPVRIKKVVFTPRAYVDATYVVSDYKIQGSNDGSTYTDLYSGTNTNGTNESTVILNNTTNYEYISFLGINCNNNSGRIALKECQFYGRADVNPYG